MNAHKAAHVAGWVSFFNFWVFTDVLRMDEYHRPPVYVGTAKELCLSQGIKFDE